MKISSDKAFQSKYCFVTFKHDIQHKRNSECKQKMLYGLLSNS